MAAASASQRGELVCLSVCLALSVALMSATLTSVLARKTAAPDPSISALGVPPAALVSGAKPAAPARCLRGLFVQRVEGACKRRRRRLRSQVPPRLAPLCADVGIPLRASL